MAKVALSVFAELPPQHGIASADETPDAAIETRIVFDERRAPLSARLHDMPAGARLGWRGSRTGHLAYVWSGTLRVGGETLDAGSVVVVEHRASLDVAAGADGCTLLVFNPSAAALDESSRAGGNVHVLPAADVPRKSAMADSEDFGAAMYMNACCPTCELWLHENSYRHGGYLVAPHSHSEDEIIVVTAGEIVLGRRTYGRGTAIAIARDTLYSFRTGEGGLAYINFRARRPTYRPAGAREAIDELAYYADLPAPPLHHPLPAV